jgi:D-glycero-alpha-D-manno-heptose-7-phosphate kinase
LKRGISSSISSDLIDVAYQKALDAGAVGGKLLGAGGNGFMLLYVGQREKAAVREALSDFREMPFRFDECGSTVVYTDENHMN